MIAETVLRRVVTGWALCGGGVLLALAAVTGFSVLRDLTFGRPYAGGFELVELGAALAAFSFLPYAQHARAHATADLLSRRAGPRTVAAADLLAAATALLIAMLLFWRMSVGMADYRADGETTLILRIPLWWAFPPILVSLALLAIVAARDVGRAFGAVRAG